MSSFLTTNAENAMNQYLDDTYAVTLVQDRPFLDRITKKAGMGGLGTKVPFNVGYGGGQSSSFETALSNAQDTGAVRYAWTISPAKEYGVTVVENSEVPFSQTDNSVIDFALDCTRGAMENAAQNFATLILGSDGTGAFATISTATNTSGSIWDLLLTDPVAVNKLNLNNQIVSAATPTSSLDGGSAIVLGLNPIAGIVTVDVGATGMTPTANHVIGLAGQFLGGSTITNFAGVYGFIPPVTSRTNGVVGDTFLGITRNSQTAVVAVSGWAADARGKALFPVISSLAGQMATFKNSNPDTLIVNPTTLSKLCVELDVKARYDMKSITDASVYFSGIEILTPAGKVDVLADSANPSDKMLLTKASTWHYGYPERPFGPSNLSGKIAVESYDHDRTNFRVMAAGYFYTTNPSASGCISLTP